MTKKIKEDSKINKILKNIENTTSKVLKDFSKADAKINKILNSVNNPNFTNGGNIMARKKAKTKKKKKC